VFKQPRVPEYRENDGASRYLRALTLFLKDFCQEAWTAFRQIKKVSEDALAKDGTAADSAKLGGVPAGEYAKKSGLKFSELYYNKDSQAANPIAINSGMWTKVVEFSVPIPSDGQYLIIAGLALQAHNGGISILEPIV